MSNPVEQHYTLPGIFDVIMSTLEKTGIEKRNVTRHHLSAADEFHVRGLEVSKELASGAGLKAGMQVLDVGCGVGGPCRLLADEYGCFCTGIDLTEEFVSAATKLSQLTGLQDKTKFLQADALALPFAANSFDTVWTQHVQMNIADKQKFYSEISRVLKPGGKFIYYDIFCTTGEPIKFPVPWASNSAISHLFSKDELHNTLSSLGLELQTTIDQTAAAIQFISALLEKVKTTGAPPVSLRIVMGDSLGEKMGNLLQNLVDNKLALESGVCIKK